MADTADSPVTKVREYILETWGHRFDGEALDSNASLIRSSMIDSFGVLDLVVFLEDTFGITISDDDVRPENLDCLASIADFVQSRRSAL